MNNFIDAIWEEIYAKRYWLGIIIASIVLQTVWQLVTTGSVELAAYLPAFIYVFVASGAICLAFANVADYRRTHAKAE